MFTRTHRPDIIGPNITMTTSVYLQIDRNPPDTAVAPFYETRILIICIVASIAERSQHRKPHSAIYTAPHKSHFYYEKKRNQTPTCDSATSSLLCARSFSKSAALRS
ncbi:hypothetical protein GQ600_4895 [Phytophthora cactorum]|nr:hypothetical protein GQ600_4895 [Phytophthora cactorum]